MRGERRIDLPDQHDVGLDVNLATDTTARQPQRLGLAEQRLLAVAGRRRSPSPTSGTHTMRIQVREDGVQFDQIVLSSAQFLTAAPGGVTNDTTIVPKP